MRDSPSCWPFLSVAVRRGSLVHLLNSTGTTGLCLSHLPLNNIALTYWSLNLRLSGSAHRMDFAGLENKITRSELQSEARVRYTAFTHSRVVVSQASRGTMHHFAHRAQSHVWRGGGGAGVWLTAST